MYATGGPRGLWNHQAERICSSRLNIDTNVVVRLQSLAGVGSDVGVPCVEVRQGDPRAGGDARTGIRALNLVEAVAVAGHAGLVRRGRRNAIAQGGRRGSRAGGGRRRTTLTIPRLT